MKIFPRMERMDGHGSGEMVAEEVYRTKKKVLRNCQDVITRLHSIGSPNQRIMNSFRYIGMKYEKVADQVLPGVTD